MLRSQLAQRPIPNRGCLTTEGGFDNFNPDLRHYLPLEIRQDHYNECRSRIFNENPDPRKVPKVRQKFARKRKEIKNVIESIRRAGLNEDPRMFAEVELQGVRIRGLLDSGASVSVLGKGCRELVESLNCDIRTIFSNVRTASGHEHRILGSIRVNIRYKELVKELELYLCPDLEQALYLGMDFWKLFNIAPELLEINEINMEQLQKEFANEKVEHKLNPHELDEEQKMQLQAVIKSFDTFEEKGLGVTSLEKHSIKLIEGAVPVKDRHYPLSPAVQSIVYEEIDNMLRLNVIEESESPWSHRTTVVRKPGKNRFCLDARKLNKLTIKDAYPLQNIDGILSRIDETHYISSVDLKYAFWQIELDEESKPYTAFTVPGRPLYQFRVMPFGLCNAAQRLCRLMDRVIPQRLKENVFIYLDDLLVISSDFQEHLRLLGEVAKCLSQANLTIGLKKSHFCFKELKYLGFIIGNGMLKTDPDKVQAIRLIRIPKSPREVRSFLGTAGWYRRFIKDFASISAPLTDTLKKSCKFTMGEKAIAAFEKLKKALTSAPVLRHPDFTRRFYIQCDASDYGTGAVLFQLDDSNEEHPIAFYSQKLNSCQRNYSVTEKECLAAVMAVKKFRPYVEMMPFTVITDHASLKWLMSLKDLSGRLARWSLQLQVFDFEIVHRKGSDNIVADMLSRSPIDVNIEELTREDFLDFETCEFEGEEYLALIEDVMKDNDRLPDIKVKDGLVFKKTVFEQELDEVLCWKLWIPPALTHVIIEKAHNAHTAAHGGVAKTLERVKRFFYWPRMSTQVRQFIKNCQVCQETKPSNRHMMPEMGQEVQTDRPFQKIYMDFLGKYPRSRNGNAYIFIVVDHFTKFTFLKAMREATTANVVTFLANEIFHKFGVPEVIHSDNGAQFTSRSFQDMVQAYGITHMKTAVYSPQSNASERVNQSVISAIRAYLDEDHRDWDMYLSEIECALRTSVHSATGFTPFFALFGFHMYTNGADYRLARRLRSLTDHEIQGIDGTAKMEAIREKIKINMHNAYQRSSARYNQRARVVKFVPGQEVYRRNVVLSDFSKNKNSKFCRKFLKCRIVKPVGNHMYELETMQGRKIGVYHVKDIKV